MGAICGIVTFDTDGLSVETADAMAAALAYRAPGGIARYRSRNGAFAQATIHSFADEQRSPEIDRELVVIGDLVLTNGEQLRHDLDAPPDSTQGQLVSKAWRRWGDRTVDHLEGSFAFAVWDETSRNLT